MVLLTVNRVRIRVAIRAKASKLTSVACVAIKFFSQIGIYHCTWNCNATKNFGRCRFQLVIGIMFQLLELCCSIVGPDVHEMKVIS